MIFVYISKESMCTAGKTEVADCHLLKSVKLLWVGRYGKFYGHRNIISTI